MTPDINKILKGKPRPCKYGAPMGKSQRYNGETFGHDRSAPSNEPLYVQRIRFVDGDYAPDGTYWGNGGGPLYCCFNDDSEIYVRAADRKAAVAWLRENYPNASIRGTELKKA